MGDIDAAAGVVTAGLIARAIEPRAGEGLGHGAQCLNCGTALVGSHCHACGQAGHVHRTVGAIGHDLLHGVLHFEGKAWHTLPMLAFRPGELTRRYIDGERARFVSPIALFLFSVFLMFAVVANLPGWNFGDSDMLKPGVASRLAEVRTGMAAERAAAQTRLADANAGLAAARAATPVDADTVALEQRRVARAKERLAAAIATERALDTSKLPEIKAQPGSAGGSWVEQKYRHAKENPALLFYKIKTSAYKFSWALIPISLPFIWLLFPLRRDVGMYDHAVFATYSLTFMSLFVILLASLGALGVSPALLTVAGFVVPPLHIYRQLKGGYGLSRGGALWRTFLMLNFAVFTSTMFILLLLYLGVAD